MLFADHFLLNHREAIRTSLPRDKGDEIHFSLVVFCLLIQVLCTE
jgi:hypothetical protein